MRSLVLIVHNVRSLHNVGSLLRTADGLGVEGVYLTGYTPAPHYHGDKRLPHISRRAANQIHKTALGAELSLAWYYEEDFFAVLTKLKNDGFQIIAIEQAKKAIKLSDFKPGQKLALLVGREVEGVEPAILKACDEIVEIPMFGKKESFNVAHAAAIALAYCRFNP